MVAKCRGDGGKPVHCGVLVVVEMHRDATALPSPPPLSLLPLRRTSVPPSRKVLLCKTKQRTDRAKRLSDTDAFGGCGFLPVCAAEPLFEWDNNKRQFSTEHEHFRQQRWHSTSIATETATATAAMEDRLLPSLDDYSSGRSAPPSLDDDSSGRPAPPPSNFISDLASIRNRRRPLNLLISIGPVKNNTTW